MEERFERWLDLDAQGKKHYDCQSHIIEEALATPNQSLNSLLALMRTHEEGAVYILGTRLDSKFGLGSNDIGAAISVLPQDGKKAAAPGYHPGSSEAYVVFQGCLNIEVLDQGHLRAENCGQFDIFKIPLGQCHRVRYESEREAASFIIKTNPHHKPGVVRCDRCIYYDNQRENCPLRKSWLQESDSLSDGK